MLGADDQLGMAGEDHRQGVRALEPTQRRLGRFDRRHAALEIEVDELRDGLGVGLGLNSWPSVSSSPRSSAWFSMMPLCTTATRAVPCGCALPSVGAPCVAQRVWPMPVVPGRRLVLQHRAQIDQLAGGPAALDAAIRPG